MILLLAAALGGGVVSFTVLWPHGALIALAGAQLGATHLDVHGKSASRLAASKGGADAGAPGSDPARKPGPERIVPGDARSSHGPHG